MSSFVRGGDSAFAAVDRIFVAQAVSSRPPRLADEEPAGRPGDPVIPRPP